jgi:hypothetical protein
MGVWSHQKLQRIPCRNIMLTVNHVKSQSLNMTCKCCD